MKIKILLFTLLISILPVFTGCRNAALAERSFFALDTFCKVQTDTNHSDVLKQIEKFVRSYDERMTRYTKGSAMNTLNTQRKIRDKEIFYILSYIVKNEASLNGFFDPLMADLIDLWDFNSGGRIPLKKEIRKALNKRKTSAVNLKKKI